MPGAAGSGTSVSFARSAITATFSPRYQSLLEPAETCDVPVRWSLGRNCHTCMTSLIGGSVTYQPSRRRSSNAD